MENRHYNKSCKRLKSRELIQQFFKDFLHTIHQANGAAEKAVQESVEQLRTMKMCLGAKLKCKVEAKWAILQWMRELAPEMRNRCQVGRDGRTTDCMEKAVRSHSSNLESK